MDGIYRLDHFNYNINGAIYFCKECYDNNGLYLYPVVSQSKKLFYGYFIYSSINHSNINQYHSYCTISSHSNPSHLNYNHNNNNNNISSIFDIKHCQYWYPENIIVTYCNSVCVKNSHLKFVNGEYKYHHFNKTLKSNIYYNDINKKY